ncbi:Uroporphyrinogen-III methyltransferase [Geobacillus stearothermophilus]|uniref:uroporphyrinogen-III C-methyltransferase n=1 Tax=Geobacillus stearothermophilus TaxID=1422 RepID=A0ABQ7HF12_GEOSE|nr:Uroporphyrinogen-III methyltransferase [Geobacillus stearothermophilus]
MNINGTFALLPAADGITTERAETTMGKVYLVGAGPGDPELITVKGLKCIQQADVILYDRLINEDLLAYAKPDAELIFCGKLPGYHAMQQETINRSLVLHAKKENSCPFKRRRSVCVRARR